jgi:hypothetical protein
MKTTVAMQAVKANADPAIIVVQLHTTSGATMINGRILIPSTKMASVKRLAPGTPANDLPIPPRTERNADHAARHGANGGAGEFHELLAARRVNPEREPLRCHGGPGENKKSGDDHGGGDQG